MGEAGEGGATRPLSCDHSLIDPRPQQRIIDVDLMRRLHLELEGEPCEVCDIRVGSILHHVKYRSRGGDDTRANLLWICPVCDADHGALPSISRYS